MYTIINGDIYLIQGNKLVKQVIKKGVLVATKETAEMPKNITSVLTYAEVKIKFINKFNEVEDEEVVEIEKPASKVLDKDKEEDNKDKEN